MGIKTPFHKLGHLYTQQGYSNLHSPHKLELVKRLGKW